MILPRVHCHCFAASGEARPAPAAPSRSAKGTKTTGRRRALGVRSAKRANLTASRKETVKVPNYEDVSCGRSYRISQFLSHPSGVESMLNARAMESYQLIDSTTYRFRCVLPTVNILYFEATPVLDLQLTLTSEGCKVEMLSCKLNGSEVVERQNNHYKAYMTNHIRWSTDDLEDFLEVDVELGLVLEIFSLPFVMLPESAVEIPGNVAPPTKSAINSDTAYRAQALTPNQQRTKQLYNISSLKVNKVLMQLHLQRPSMAITNKVITFKETPISRNE